jgi:hypothetical protein
MAGVQRVRARSRTGGGADSTKLPTSSRMEALSKQELNALLHAGQTLATYEQQLGELGAWAAQSNTYADWKRWLGKLWVAHHELARLLEGRLLVAPANEEEVESGD